MPRGRPYLYMCALGACARMRVFSSAREHRIKLAQVRFVAVGMGVWVGRHCAREGCFGHGMPWIIATSVCLKTNGLTRLTGFLLYH